ncbi:AimR family lysis-lysogeny pheromone receptor [Bacillus cereus group sp. Bce041]|uniref:AimR family lysis-lysogeny pheromone receptor n=1 Tax=Bacillus cereus group sp. Bce041 TaxID=3445228 RepID=UPI004042E042
MNTLSLLSEIHADMKKKGINDIQISDKLQVTKGLVSQYFKGKTKISFMNFVKLVRHVYEDSALVQKYILRFCADTTKPLNLCIAMEFASANRNIELLTFLVQKGKTFNNKMVKEWASHYDFLCERSKGNLIGEKLFKKISKSSIKTTKDEMKVLKSIILMYSFSDMQEFTSLIKTVPEITVKEGIQNAQKEETENEDVTVENLKESYFKDAYDIRMKELQLVANLMDNNITAARKIGESIIQNDISKEFPRFLASTYEFLGISYLFEDTYKSQILVQKAIEVLKTENTDIYNDKIAECQQTLDFIRIDCGVDLDKINPVDIGEKAHLAIKRGLVEEGIRILEEIKRENGTWTAFQWYYMGLATGEEYYFRQSTSCFEQHGNKFYVQLPNRFIRENR